MGGRTNGCCTWILRAALGSGSGAILWHVHRSRAGDHNRLAHFPGDRLAQRSFTPAAMRHRPRVGDPGRAARALPARKKNALREETSACRLQRLPMHGGRSHGEGAPKDIPNPAPGQTVTALPRKMRERYRLSAGLGAGTAHCSTAYTMRSISSHTSASVLGSSVRARRVSWT